MAKYSLITPVFNQPEGIDQLLLSLKSQSFKDFEIIVVEDGSINSCQDIVNNYSKDLTIKYLAKENTGPGDSRNHGAKDAKGDYFIFFDADCIIPERYFEVLDEYLKDRDLDFFGGPDGAHPSFSSFQKAASYTMNSYIGVGAKNENSQLGFNPRSFNMGIKRSVFEEIGGFGTLRFGEDTELSYRVLKADFKSEIIKRAFVYQRRERNVQSFLNQIYKFGIVRGILTKLHPDRFRLFYTLPIIFFILFALSILGIGVSFNLFVLFAIIIGIDAFLKTQKLNVAAMSIVTSFCYLTAYGYGFLKSAVFLFLLNKNAKQSFKNFFHEKKEL